MHTLKDDKREIGGGGRCDRFLEPNNGSWYDERDS